MSAAQLLNPKAESRVGFLLLGGGKDQLTLPSEEEKLSRSTSVLVKACKMF
jgi:hypothetical protein